MGLAEAMSSSLKAGERPVKTFQGLTAGLNASPSAGRTRGQLFILERAIVIGFEKVAVLSKKKIVERFEVMDVIGVSEADVEMTGLAGSIARRNTSSPLGRALGSTDTNPAVTLSTRRGDIVFAFKPKERGVARDAFVTISDMLQLSDEGSQGGRPQGDDSVMDQIERLHELQTKGVLSAQEYEAKKAELLGRL